MGLARYGGPIGEPGPTMTPPASLEDWRKFASASTLQAVG